MASEYNDYPCNMFSLTREVVTEPAHFASAIWLESKAKSMNMIEPVLWNSTKLTFRGRDERVDDDLYVAS